MLETGFISSISGSYTYYYFLKDYFTNWDGGKVKYKATSLLEIVKRQNG